MDLKKVPTKGNLLAQKKSHQLAKIGYDLMDKKRNILIREMMALVKRATEIQEDIKKVYIEAYKALKRANITLGISKELAKTVPVEESLKVTYRSVMGVEIPLVFLDEEKEHNIPYGFYGSNSLLDEAYRKFIKVKRLTAKLSEIENSVYRLADAIRKTQKRANALKNIVLPSFEESIKFITAALEEKEREEFSRLKVIKAKL